MNNEGPIQKILMTPEYEDIEDIVMVESLFVELDKRGEGKQIVRLAVTPDRFILARCRVINYRDNPDLIYDADRDLDSEGLEIRWLAPLDKLDIAQLSGEYILKVTPMDCPSRHFELCTRSHPNDVWQLWACRLGYVGTDPYGYIKRHSLRLDIEDSGDIKDESDASTSDSDAIDEDPVKKPDKVASTVKKNTESKRRKSSNSQPKPKESIKPEHDNISTDSNKLIEEDSKKKKKRKTSFCILK